MKIHHILATVLLSSCVLSARSKADTLFLIDDSNNTLLQMDPASDAISTVGPTGVATGDFGSLAYDPANSTLFWSAGRGNGNLYTINQTTGAATLVGPTGVTDLFALAYDPANNTFYGANGNKSVYEINPATGAATQIDANNGVFPTGLTYNSATGQLVELTLGQIYVIDPVTGAATRLGNIGSSDNGGATYDPSRNAYWIDQYGPKNVLEVDATSYSGSAVQTYSDSLNGIAYVVPEPSTYAMVGIGALLSIGWMRRRRRMAA